MSDDEQVIIIYCTCPDAVSARNIADALVAGQLVACANLLAGVASIYRWQDRVETDTEQLLLLKTVRRLMPQVSRQISTLHPYEVPEIIAAPIVEGNREYLQWVRDATRAGA